MKGNEAKEEILKLAEKQLQLKVIKINNEKKAKERREKAEAIEA